VLPYVSLVSESKRTGFDRFKFVCYADGFKDWRLSGRLPVVGVCGKSGTTRQLCGADFKTREARDESAAFAANKVAVCVIVGHG
jgi:hypothetical protein